MAARQETTKITSAMLHQWQNDGNEFILIDILINDHYTARHIPGAVQACVFEMSFLDQIKDLVDTRDQMIIIYGADEQAMDTAVAADKLARAGYQNVHILEGGLTGWMAAGFTIEGHSILSMEPEPTFAQFKEGNYTADPEQSEMNWTGRNPNSTHHGTVHLSSGSLTVKDGLISGSFEIDMTSIVNVNLAGGPLQKVLEDHLKSDDFFFVERFPKAAFTLQSATPIADRNASTPNYTVKGLFELLGVQQALSFAATVNPRPDGGYAIEAHFDMDRTKWGVVYGSSRFFKYLGMHLVFDLISLQLRFIVQ